MSRALVVIGDGVAGGYGDTRAFGWVGRVIARSATPQPDFYAVLPVLNETTTQMMMRYEHEASLRWDRPDNAGGAAEKRLVIAPGNGDALAGMSLARTRLNLANMVDEAASQGVSTLVVGPTPLGREHGAAADEVAGLDGAMWEVCSRRNVPYVPLYRSLSADERWLADLGTTDGIHPSQLGYAMIAHLVLVQGWHEWFGSSEA